MAAFTHRVLSNALGELDPRIVAWLRTLTGLAWVRGSLAATDWNLFYSPGVHRISSTGHTNMPPVLASGAINGFLTVTNIDGGAWAMQEFVRQGTAYERWWRISTNTTGAWSPWILNNGTKFVTLATGSDANALPVSATYEVTSNSVAAGVANLPVAQPGMLEHFRTSNGIVIQRYTTYGLNQTVYLRTSLSVTQGTLGPWAPISGGGGGGSTPAPAAPSTEAGLTNDLLMQDFTRRRGGRKRVTSATVAFRFDHGLTNFDTKIRPLMESRNLPYALALCSGQWDRAENAGVTAAMVNAWVVAGLAEIWNHTKDHGSGDNSDAQWKSAILDGLTELRTQLPAAQIDGFAPPGSTGVDFGGFAAANSVQQFYATEGGRFILANHAVAAGYIPGVLRILDGRPRQGMSHSTLDSATFASVQTLIGQAQAQKRGLQLMLHPSLLDTGAYITTATFTQILDYVVAERDAGRLRVMGPYDQLLADVV